MLKNAVIIVLVIALAVMSYKYITLYDNVKAVQEQDVITDIYDTGRFKLYRYSEISYFIEDNNKKFRVFFIYDTNGLQSFSIQDFLTDKGIFFNISEEGILENYMYIDKNYEVMTNIERTGPDQMIQRGEWYSGYATTYELLTDGSTNLTVKSADFVEW